MQILISPKQRFERLFKNGQNGLLVVISMKEMKDIKAERSWQLIIFKSCSAQKDDTGERKLGGAH